MKNMECPYCKNKNLWKYQETSDYLNCWHDWIGYVNQATGEYEEVCRKCGVVRSFRLQANTRKGERPVCNHKWREIEKGEGDYREFGKQCLECNEVIWD